MILRAEPGIEVVGESEDGLAVVEAATTLRPGVVLMDVRMPNLDGIEATRRIVAGPEPTPRVLVLTTFDLDEYVYEALVAGASGFLLKDVPEDQLAAGDSCGRGRGRYLLAVGDAPAHRGDLSESSSAGSSEGARGPDPARARGAEVGGSWPLQRGDRGNARGQRTHREDSCRPHSRQARPARPRPGRRPRLRVRARRTWEHPGLTPPQVILADYLENEEATCRNT
jgi:CheY-like chemotaxis protein